MGIRGGADEVGVGRCEHAHSQKKHPCRDCRFCQWCGDDRCHLCRMPARQEKKLSLAEQVALYEAVNCGRKQGGGSSD